MSFVPPFSSPCDFAIQTPAMVAEFLDLKSKLARERSEGSVTDLLVSCLLKLSFAEVTVVVPYEVETGSDFDLMILDSTRSTAIQYRLQAKKLTHNGVSNWQHRSYRELDHPHGTGEQAKTLIRSSSHEKVETIPLYVFYNDADTCNQSSGAIEGIALADGVSVARLVRALVAARPKRLPHKRIGTLSSLFFPFSTLLCPAEPSAPSGLISPIASRQRAVSALEATRTRWQETRPFEEKTPAIGWHQIPDEFVSERRISGPPRQPDIDHVPDWEPRRDVEIIPTPKVPAKRRPKDSLLPVAIERALERKTDDGVVRAPVKRTKVVLEPK